MTQIMIEVGSSNLDPVRNALETALADVGYTTEVLPPERTASLIYCPTQEGLGTLFNQAAAGQVSSVRFRTDGNDIAWALLFSPIFGAKRVRPWTGVVELRHSMYGPLFDSLIKRRDLDFVVVSQEETLDLGPRSIAPTTFPWDDWRLVRAGLSVTSADGVNWMIRAGPAAETVGG